MVSKYHYRYILLGIIILLFSFFLRFFKVAEYPVGLYVDEVAIGYNAYSILKTGRDEFNRILPLFFESYGDWKLPVYIYLTSFSEALFGKNDFAVRFPSVFLGSLSIGIMIVLVNILTNSRNLSLLSGFLLSISPWHLQFSRPAFEVNMSLFFTLMATFLTILGIKRQSNIFFLGILFYILSFYTYHTPRLFCPLLFFLVLLLYKKQLASFLKSRLSIIFTSLLLFLTIPFMVFSLSSSGLVRLKSVSFLKDVTYPDGGTISQAFLLNTNQLLKNYFTYFSSDYLFFSGDGNGRHNVREIGLNYIWQIPFFIFGISQVIKKRNIPNNLFFGWLIFSPIAASFATPNPHALRSLFLTIPFIFFISKGIIFVLGFFRRSILYKAVLIFSTIYFFLIYLHIYYVHYPKRSSPDWSGGFRETLKYVLSQEDQYTSIAITKKMTKGYAYLYFYGSFDPVKIQQSDNPQAGFDKFVFVDSPYEVRPKEKFLYVAPFWENWPGKLIKTIYNTGGDMIFRIWAT